MPKRLDLTDKRFTRLTVLCDAGRRRTKGGQSVRRWLCKCDCGVVCLVDTRGLTAGNSKSCGCYNIEAIKTRSTTHGATIGRKQSKLYQRWAAMHSRCSNPNDKHFSDYGARGIKVCEEWKDFAVFARDVGEPPTWKHTLDRIENEGNYEPGNCRWATLQEQARNKRNTVYVTYQNRRMPLAAAAAAAGLPIGAVYSRRHSGWDEDEWLLPLGAKRKSIKQLKLF